MKHRLLASFWRRSPWRALFPAVTVLALAWSATSANAADKIVFNRDIRPILTDNCFLCHGPDKGKRKAELRLDVREEALKLQAFVPGNPDESDLVARIMSNNPARQMPPPKSNKKLTAEQKALFQRWIAEGAAYQGHWAYEKPLRAAVPPGANGVDFLVQKRLAPLGLKPSPQADPRTLIRRLSFDLLGLPPAAAEVDAFVQASNRNPQAAYEQLVDRLLASPHFGERLAMGWLDVVRFADTMGYHADNPHNAWPFRDYVIRAFNNNKTFDQFTLEQLAGDLLPGSTTEQKVASCFNHLLLTTEEGGAQPKDYEARMLADRVRAVGTVWLGQTFGCCQCHDHKFDPITQKDFYSLGAFFADIREPIIGRRDPGIALADDKQTAELARLRKEVDTLQKQVDPKTPNQADQKKKLDAAKKALADFEANIPHCMVTVATNSPRTVRLLKRGNWMDDSGPVMPPALPKFLGPGVEGKSRLTRLDLARWIISRDNPLTARVFVNRLWKQFFGLGLSKQLDDLGSQGEWPVNPELLDWLACDFMDHHWNVKHVVRLMVTSQTYRQVSTVSKELLARDPDNRLLARQSRYRLEAELVRDNALAVSGLLSAKIGGPSVKPYQPDGYWENLNFPPRQYHADHGESQYRRGLYVWWQRTFPHPSMIAFDAPTREECCADRTRSNIPQQALVLLNDPTYVEAARALAARILQEGGSTAPNRIKWAWRQVLQREPGPDEVERVAGLLEKHHKEYEADPKSALAVLKVGFQPPPAQLKPAELAAWTSVARVLLNLHETITRN
jgi:Protein of unknown function (DUF1553)/Protein of unknown function (DUF1549)/Planctomycete cytochrome C